MSREYSLAWDSVMVGVGMPTFPRFMNDYVGSWFISGPQNAKLVEYEPYVAKKRIITLPRQDDIFFPRNYRVCIVTAKKSNQTHRRAPHLLGKWYSHHASNREIMGVDGCETGGSEEGRWPRPLT
jgi:hypothetical protein